MAENSPEPSYILAQNICYDAIIYHLTAIQLYKTNVEALMEIFFFSADLQKELFKNKKKWKFLLLQGHLI